MIDKDKQREFLMALAGALSENKTDKEEEFAKTSFKLFTTLVKTGFTEEQAMTLMTTLIAAIAHANQ